MSAFDDLERKDVEPSGHLISRADYLNASARPEAARVRAQIDAMLLRYPEAHRDALIRRIRSPNDDRHRSAVLELAVHELLIRSGFRILAVEPPLLNGRSPDFLVEAPDSQRFYLEATVATGEAGADPGADRRLREVLQALDDVRSPDFFLSLHMHGTPNQQIAVGRLRRRIERWVESLDYDEVNARLAADGPPPMHRLEEHGLTVSIEVVPKNFRGVGRRAIAVRMFAGGQVNPHLAIRTSVEGKAGHYGDLDLPLVVAVTALDQFADLGSAVDALFGTAAVAVRGDEARHIRNTDGAWRGPGGPVNTRVSAVLFVPRLSAWDLAQRAFTLIHNPWAQRPLPPAPWRTATKHLVEEQLVTTPGEPLRDVFDLPEHWPEGDETEV